MDVTTESVNVFERLGKSHDGYHVAVYFRKLVESRLKIDYAHPILLNRFCTLYNIVNNRGTVYGHLFKVDESKLTIQDNRMIVHCNVREKYDFSALAISSEKTKLLFYKSSSGCLLIVSAGNEQSEYLVKEDA